MNSLLTVASGIVITVVVAAFVYWQVANTRAQVVTTNTGGTGSMTMGNVATHADGSSCWTVINGGVYDLTSWIPEHPGGQQAILQLCGTDGSAKFNGKHGGKEPMVTILAGFKIGDLSR